MCVTIGWIGVSLLKIQIHRPPAKIVIHYTWGGIREPAFEYTSQMIRMQWSMVDSKKCNVTLSIHF